MSRFKSIAILTALFGAFFLLAACTSEEDEDTSSDDSSSSVTLSGTMFTSFGMVGGIGILSSHLPEDYSLYCVTFTDPPESGSGDFDASGSFSVTIANAAGLPIGCFINNKTTNEPVATISFTVGSASGFDDGTSSSASFDGGTYDVTIEFNITTGEATVDVQSVVSEPDPAPAGSEIVPADLVGEWALQCALDNTESGQAACNEFIPLRLFLDVITADLDTDGDLAADETVYGMGIWRSKVTYEVAGSTEGLIGNIPAEVMSGTLISLYTTNEAGVIGAFTGFTAQTGWVSADNTMSGDNVVNALAVAGIDLAYDETFDDADSGSCVALDLSTMAGRGCLLEYLQYLRGQVENDVPFTLDGVSQALLVPRTHDSVWETFVGSSNGEFSGATQIQFEEQFGGPDIPARYAMLDLSSSGAALVASQEDYNQYTDNSGGTPVTCDVFNKITITFTPSADDPAANVGWFTISEGDSCDASRAFTAAFKVIFTPQATSATLTPALMAGNFIAACRPEARGGPLGSISTTLVLTDSGGSTAPAVITEFMYENDRCEGPPASMTNLDATLTPLFDRPSAWGFDAAVIEIVLDGQSITLLTDALVIQYNTDNSGTGAYGITSWVLGSAQDVTGLGYDGSPEPADNFYELFYVDSVSGVLYTGLRGQTSVYGMANDVKPEFVKVTASDVTLATLDGRTFVQTCRDENRTEYNALSRSQSFSFDDTADTVTIVETYHSDTACSFSLRTVEEIQTFPLTEDSPGVEEPFTNRGFASPMTLDTAGGAYAHTVSVYDADAATAMNLVDSGVGAYGLTAWADTSVDVDVSTVEYDGTAFVSGAFPLSVLLQDKFLFLAIPEEGVPVRIADGYPIAFANDDPLFEVQTLAAVADLDGEWLSGCRDETTGGVDASSFDLIAISGGAVAITSSSFATADCSGVATPVADTATIDSIGDSVDFGGAGPVFEFSITDSDGLGCAVFQIFGDQLRAAFQLESLGDGDSLCETGEFPAEFDANDEPLARNITPLTATSLPIASFTSECRNYGGGSTDEMEIIQIIGDMVVANGVQFDSTGGLCDGNATEGEQWAAALVFGAEVSTMRGAATKVDVTDPFSGVAEKTLLHLEGNFRLFIGDDQGALDGSGYPTELENEPIMRNF